MAIDLRRSRTERWERALSRETVVRDSTVQWMGVETCHAGFGGRAAEAGLRRVHGLGTAAALLLGMNNNTTNQVPFPTRVKLDPEVRGTLVQMLNRRLASTLDLHSQVKQAHWNIKGAQFIARHQLFDDLAEHLLGWSDDLAERATTLGGYARGTSRQTAAASMLPEYDTEAVDGQAHLTALITRYGDFCASLREDIKLAEAKKDPATEDLLTSVLRDSETDLWFLEAHRGA